MSGEGCGRGQAYCTSAPWISATEMWWPKLLDECQWIIMRLVKGWNSTQNIQTLHSTSATVCSLDKEDIITVFLCPKTFNSVYVIPKHHPKPTSKINLPFITNQPEPHKPELNFFLKNNGEKKLDKVFLSVKISIKSAYRTTSAEFSVFSS